MAAEIEDNRSGGNGAAPAEHPPASIDPPAPSEHPAVPPEPAAPPPPPAAPLLGQSFAAPGQVVEPYDTSESAPPPSAPPQPAPAPAQPQPAPQPPVSQAPPITSMPPPPGWYGDIFGNPPRWWDGTVWTEHVLAPLPAAEPAVAAEDDVELSFLDNALISISLAPDWAKFLAAALVTAVLALIGLGLINGDSSSDDVPDGFVPQTPELEDGAIPAPETTSPTEPDAEVDR